MSAFRRLATGVFSNWAWFVTLAVTSFVMTPVLVRGLGDQAYGLWSLFMSLTGYFTLLDMGVSPAIVRFASSLEARGDRDGLRRVLGTALTFFSLAGVAVSGLVALATAYYPSLFPASGVSLTASRVAFLLLGLEFAITLPFSVYQGLLLGHQRYEVIQGMNIVTRLIRFVAVLWMMGRVEEGLLWLSVLFFVTGVMRNLGLWIASRGLLNVRIDVRDARREAVSALLSYSIPAFIISIAVRVMHYTDSLVIGYTLGVGAITLFALAASLVDYIHDIGWGLAGVLVPVVSGLEATGEVEAIGERYLQFTRYCVWIMTPVLAVCFLLGPAFFTAWVGPGYGESASILNVLSLSMGIYVVQMPTQAVMKGMSLHRYLAGLFALEAVVNLLLSLLLAPKLGVIGVAYGTLIPRALFTGIAAPAYLLAKLRISFYRYVREGALPGAIGVLVMTLLVLLGRGLLPPALSWGMMVLSGVVIFFVFAGVTFKLGMSLSERAMVIEKGKQAFTAVWQRLTPGSSGGAR